MYLQCRFNLPPCWKICSAFTMNISRVHFSVCGQKIIEFNEDYWCRNCPLSSFVALGPTETLGRLENTQSLKPLLVLVHLWPQLTGTDVYRTPHAFARIHLNLLRMLKFDPNCRALKEPEHHIVRSPDRWDYFCSVSAAAVLKGQQFNLWASFYKVGHSIKANGREKSSLVRLKHVLGCTFNPL